jgi:hypothetical protein
LITFGIAGALLVWAVLFMVLERWKSRKRPQ